MKINRDSIKKVSKILLKIPYEPISYKSYIFLPLEMAQEIESDGITLVTKDRNVGATSGTTAGLILKYIKLDDKSPVLRVCLAYANTKFCPKFDLINYTEFLGKKLSKDHIAELTQYECYLMPEENILEIFQL